uniref:Uncharacterized protein n=1 Tax=Panagrolaimus sp. ES5 TaxID=591445 RepID=A0AC34FAN3_9BILA
MIENVTIVQSFVNIFNSTDSDYEGYEEVPTIPTVTCDGEYEQLCENGIECILKQFMCDGRRDCTDNSDEGEDCQNQRVEDYPDSKGRFLPPTFKCPETWFFCKDASKCIEPAAACNGIDDCKDGSDEGGFCHYLNIERRLLSPSSSNNETMLE